MEVIYALNGRRNLDGINGGTRHRLLSKDEQPFCRSIEIFDKKYHEQLTKLACDNRWQHLIVFFEFFGENSFAGNHDVNDLFDMKIIDVCPNKKGLLEPNEFLRTFKNFDIPNFLGIYNWTHGFVERIRNNEIEGITFEGVVGKAVENKKIIMAKAKTQQWLDKVKNKFGDRAKEIIES
jgi:hypothetical protein